ncbi:hypothetical protein Tco_0462968 [Tanacetum coccineum]
MKDGNITAKLEKAITRELMSIVVFLTRILEIISQWKIDGLAKSRERKGHPRNASLKTQQSLIAFVVQQNLVVFDSSCDILYNDVVIIGLVLVIEREYALALDNNLLKVTLVLYYLSLREDFAIRLRKALNNLELSEFFRCIGRSMASGYEIDSHGTRYDRYNIYTTRDIDLNAEMMCSSGSLKESVVNISYTTTNKVFQVSKDPSGLESSFNDMYKFLAPCHILISPKPRVHTRIEPINLVLLNSVIQCLPEYLSPYITEFVHLIKPSCSLYIVTAGTQLHEETQ